MSRKYCFLLLLPIWVLFSQCTVTKPVKTGDMAYEFKQYELAVELLEKEYNKESNTSVKARKATYLANSLDILERYGEALKWYDIADQLYANENSARELAQSLKRNERYKDASKLFEEMYKKYKTIDYRREAEVSRQAMRQMEENDNFRMEALGLNSAYSDYSPVYFENDFIVFTSDREGSTGSKAYKWDDGNFSDLFVSDRNGRQVYNFDALINSEHNEGTVAFNQDFTEIFFTRCVSTENRDQYCKLFYSQRPNGFWLEPEALMFYDDQTNFAHPCLIENDSVLIFTAKTKGSNNYDLYYSVKLGKGWSEAEIMPSSINTEADELFPTSYNDTLYFSSDGLLGYGGLDIFRTHLRADGSWANPVNMGWPINSGADDFGLSLKPGYEKRDDILLDGLMSSSRNTGTSTDVFSVVLYKTKPTVEEEPEEIVEYVPQVKDYLVYLSGRVVENVFKNDDPNGEIIDQININDGQVEMLFGSSEKNYNLDLSGRFLHKVSTDKMHKLTVRTKEHLNKEVMVEIPDFSTLEKDTTINLTIALDRIQYNQEIIISNIYYDFDRWEVREDARPALDSLADLLKLNPHINIELASHTDCQGELDYNEDLSQKRAQSVVDYLNDLGINKNRMLAKGYGESVPRIECVCEECTEEEHQANRRTSFKILQPD